MARAYKHTSSIVVLDGEVYPEMARNWSKAVHEGNDIVCHQDEIRPGQPPMADSHRIIKK